MAHSVIHCAKSRLFSRLVLASTLVKLICLYHQNYLFLRESYPPSSASGLSPGFPRSTHVAQKGLRTFALSSSSLLDAILAPTELSASTCNISGLLSKVYSVHNGLPARKRRVCGATHKSLGQNITASICNIPVSALDGYDFRVEPGGHYRPHHCLPKTKVALIIPFRNRWNHLSEFLINMHPFLQKQGIEYTIYVINQEEGCAFNRGMLLNVGAVEALKIRDYDCFVFHDVDLIPENDGILYECPLAFRHLSTAIDKFDYQLPYETIVGGALAANRSAFESINGYSNLYFGWGGEDDDFAQRLLLKNYSISRYGPDIARYTMLSHSQDKGNQRNDERFDLLAGATKRTRIDGLNTLQYTVSGITKLKLFTMVNVSINQDLLVQRFLMNLATHLRLTSNRAD